MNGLPNVNAMTMSSREVAELTNKDHRHVLRDIEGMFSGLEQSSEGYAQTWTHPQNGQAYRQYVLPKDLTLTLVAGYNVKLRKRIIDRWLELEAHASAQAVPRSLPEALRLAAEAIEARDRLALENQAKAEALAAAAPKAEALDRIATANGSLCITDAAKALQLQPRRFFDWLREHRWIYRRPGSAVWLGYQDRVMSSLLEHKVTTVQRDDGSEKLVEQVRITSKGLAKISTVLGYRSAA